MRENIEKERERAKMTKAQLCKAVKINVRTYWNYMNGAAIPSDKLMEMARLFNCSTDYLLGLTKERTPLIKRAKA